MAEDQPNSGAWDDLAFYLYLAGDISGGDKAADRAVAETPKAQRSQLEQDLEEIRTEAVKEKKRLAKAQKNAPSTTTPGDNPLQNPFGGAGTAP